MCLLVYPDRVLYLRIIYCVVHSPEYATVEPNTLTGKFPCQGNNCVTFQKYVITEDIGNEISRYKSTPHS